MRYAAFNLLIPLLLSSCSHKNEAIELTRSFLPLYLILRTEVRQTFIHSMTVYRLRRNQMFWTLKNLESLKRTILSLFAV